MQSEQLLECQRFSLTSGPQKALTLEDLRNENRQVMRRLISVTMVSFLFMICEMIGGWLSGSLAILTDAAHLLSDVSGFVISILSIWIGLMPAKKSSLSYGYHRAEIIGALASVLIIWALTVWLVIEAVSRCIDPQPVNGLIMTISACIGLACNITMGIILNTNICGKIEVDARISNMVRAKEEDKNAVFHAENPNLRAAMIHILGDTIQSIGVLIAAIIIMNYPEALIADPICTFLFSIIVLATTVSVARDCLYCMMEAVPRYINVEELEEEMWKLPETVDVHDLHVWSLTTGKTSLSAHMSSKNPTKTLVALNEMLREKGILHSTVQIENWEDRKEIDCRHLKTNLIHE